MSGRKHTRAGKKPDPKPKAAVTELLAQNEKLADRLQRLLPLGVDVLDAAHAFADLEQFAAAVYVVHNLDIPMGELQLAVKKQPAASLAQIIHAQNPNVDAGFEERRALKAARRDLEELQPPAVPTAISHR